MNFTHKSYRNLLRMLNYHGYKICNYSDYESFDKCVILRHDIDFSLEKAVEFAKIEKEEGVFATYFVLVSTDFYNIHSKQAMKKLEILKDCGGKIGLHFDETRYDIDNEKQIISEIQKERNILQAAIDAPVDIVSMHRPSRKMLALNLAVPDMINSYGDDFYKKCKYVSDSRMHWREDVEEIVRLNQYKRLHILTHAFWYCDEEKSTKEILASFVNDAKEKRYRDLSDNFREIDEFLKKEEI